MRLLIGGRAQGKLAHVLEEENIAPDQILDGAACKPEDAACCKVLNHLHLLVRAMLSGGKTQEDLLVWAESLLKENPEIIILCDEIGCGIVPAERFDRDWREAVGRLCCYLARRARKVERLTCGIAVVLKG